MICHICGSDLDYDINKLRSDLNTLNGILRSERIEKYNLELDYARETARADKAESDLRKERKTVPHVTEQLNSDLCAVVEKLQEELDVQTARAASAVKAQAELMKEVERCHAVMQVTCPSIEDLRSANERLCEGLKRLEWSQVDGLRYCSQCSSQYSNGHKPDCWLAALLEKK